MGKKLVGLDIGSTAVRAVEVDSPHQQRPTILRFGEVALPEGAVKAGEVVDSATVTAAIRKLWSSNGFKTRDVVMGIGNSKVLARDITVPRLPLNQVRESLPFQVQDLLPVPASDALLDFYPASELEGETGPMLQGMLVAAIKAPLLVNVNAAVAASVQPVNVDLSAFALTRLFAGGESGNTTTLLVHIGAATTTLVALEGHVPHFIRFLPNGGADITKGISQRLDISTRDAEAIKRSVGVVAARATAEQRPALEVSFELVNETLLAIRATIQYFQNARNNRAIDRIVMSGGGSRLLGLAETVGEFTKVPTTQPDPFSFATAARGLRGTGDAQDMSVALGLVTGASA
ncbi:type IV pilus assembly protein PilM [Salinibacterium sp. SWN1162]|uniref:type IV pilus assembly protein PilM n=1 Tax=Salinibacterium sp. SWN1162 TaxID=2792053 RepID=UPI0018CE668C|nr:type IV pilus assembly protein PilM [Salinibacterium sp. SWN1162]MBH0008444.1 type IV pilus assembly protein PilM [Salinibacterium sp. SWN1162]